jgi:hypothetical protein
LRVDVDVVVLLLTVNHQADATAMVQETLAELEVCTQQRMNLLPLAWQRKAFFDAVHAPGSSTVMTRVQKLVLNDARLPALRSLLARLLAQVERSVTSVRRVRTSDLEAANGALQHEVLCPPRVGCLVLNEWRQDVEEEDFPTDGSVLLVLQQLHDLGVVLAQWSSRPDYDQVRLSFVRSSSLSDCV